MSLAASVPQDCSICGRLDNDLTLIDGCTWLCRKCKLFLNDLKSERK